MSRYTFLYNILLFIWGIISLPWMLWKRITQGKRFTHLSHRLGFHLPQIDKDYKVFWIHAVSVGEVRSCIVLYRELKKLYPKVKFVISTITETGYREAHRSLTEADHYFILPLDFSWTMRVLIRRLHPDLLLVAEGDFWYNMLTSVKRRGCRICLINGKISSKSTHRFQRCSFFSRYLFRCFDYLCVQNEEYARRFFSLGIEQKRIIVSGNLKLDVRPILLRSEEKQKWYTELGITSEDRIVTVGSTHDSEEEIILSACESLWKQIPHFKILLVPRHPERFPSVASLLSRRNLSFFSYTDRDHKKGDEKVILIDKMGLLNTCYQFSELALVGGSFVAHVGGHNIFEPTALGVPVLFGPYMEQQKELVNLILHHGCGRQVGIENLTFILLELLVGSPQTLDDMKKKALDLSHHAGGATERTLQTIASCITSTSR